jgi:hypothetical protein
LLNTRLPGSTMQLVVSRHRRLFEGAWGAADVKGAGNSRWSQQRGSLIQSLPDRDPQPER